MYTRIGSRSDMGNPERRGAVTGCPRGYRLSVRYSRRNREDDKNTLHDFSKKLNLNDDKHYDVITYKCHDAKFLSNTNLFKMWQ